MNTSQTHRFPYRKRNSARISLACLVAAMGFALGGLASPVSSEPPGDRPDWTASLGAVVEQALAELRGFETARRAATDFTTLASSERSTGSNPSRIVRAPGRNFLVGLLRGEDALVVLGDGLTEVARLDTPPLPTGLAVTEDGVVVSGMGSGDLAWYRWQGNELKLANQLTAPEPASFRDLAVDLDGSRIYAVDELGSRLMTLDFESGPDGFQLVGIRMLPLPRGPIQVMRTTSYLAVNSLLDHTVSVFAVRGEDYPDPARSVRITYDGPIWGMDCTEDSGRLRLALGGVEDHPLDRSGGFFGHIDSYLYLVDITQSADSLAVTRQAELNLSAFGVITPKALDLTWNGAETVVRAAGYGGETLVEASWDFDLNADPEITRTRIPPGTNDLLVIPEQGLLLANSLLDAWISVGEHGYFIFDVRSSRPETRSFEQRLGESLFFTELMGPDNTSEGAHSRFTCETCHFEGGIDGRTHFTGRGTVHATTKPLHGLFNNQPHFSRALDADLTTMVHNEFRVANAETGRDPWSALYIADYPWMRELDAEGAMLRPEVLRRSLLEFFMEFTHPANPRVRKRTTWTDQERAGAELFAQECASCHAPRLIADDPDSEQAFATWESLIFSEAGPLVWGSEFHARTGILPYVHDDGARSPSLRRVSRKVPYFTNGTSRNLHEVVRRARYGDGVFLHEAGDRTDLNSFTPAQQAALAAFLLLL